MILYTVLFNLKNQDKLITIGITAFNEKDFLLDAWNSVVNQTDNRWEAIMILDGGAEGKTQRIFDSITHSSLKKIKLEKNNGPYFTRTLAIKNAVTDWYCHLDADDRFSIDTVKHINETINEFPDIEFIIGDSIYFDDLNFQVKSHSLSFQLCGRQENFAFPNINPNTNMSKTRINKMIIDKGFMYFLKDIFE